MSNESAPAQDSPADAKAEVQCRNAATLARQTPLRGDGLILFKEVGHTYTAWGKRVMRSTTAVLADFFETVIPHELVDRYAETWLKDPQKRWHSFMLEHVGGGGTFADAKTALLAHWVQIGEQASELGTLMHLHCEYDANGEALPPDPRIEKEIAQYDAFKRSEWFVSRGLEPYRTELCVAYRHKGTNVCAGQVDIVYRGTRGEYAGQHFLVDFKRVKREHALDPEERGYTDRHGVERTALLGLGHVPDTHYARYSLQTAVYNVMLEHTHKVDVEDRMYLLRMHADRDEFELVQCADYRSEAFAMLAHEYMRVKDL